MSNYELGWVKDISNRSYQVIWDTYTKKVYAKYTGSGVLSFGSSHYEIGTANSAQEAMLKAQAWVVTSG